MSGARWKASDRMAVDDLPRRFAQALGRQPFDIAVRMASGKRRRELLRAEAARQVELEALGRERVLRDVGELWCPAPGTRLAREWEEAKRHVQQGARNAA